jgi:predicted XRE-type DNA-binding protein
MSYDFNVGPAFDFSCFDQPDFGNHFDNTLLSLANQTHESYGHFDLFTGLDSLQPFGGGIPSGGSPIPSTTLPPQRDPFPPELGRGSSAPEPDPPDHGRVSLPASPSSECRRISPLPERVSPAPATTRTHIGEFNNTTWAARNPTRPVLPTRPVPARLTDAQKASREIARRQRKLNTEKLNTDIKAFVEAEQLKIAEIAKAHNVTTDKVKDLVGTHTHYRKARKPALHNAILHAKAAEVNKGNLSTLFVISG